MKKPYTKMTAAELAQATAEYDQPVNRKLTRPLSAAERSMWKKASRGPGRPRIGKGSVNVLISFEMGLLSRTDAWAKSQSIGRSRLIALALETYMARNSPAISKRALAG
jgi:hypothetical protein